MKESKEQVLLFLKRKRFELAHLVIDTQEALISQLGKDPLIDGYYHGIMSAVDNLLKLENKLKGE